MSIHVVSASVDKMSKPVTEDGPTGFEEQFKVRLDGANLLTHMHVCMYVCAYRSTYVCMYNTSHKMLTSMPARMLVFVPIARPYQYDRCRMLPFL